MRMRGIAWVPLLLVIASCQGSGDLPLDQADPGAVASNPTFDQVNAIMHRSCVPCHQGGGEDVAAFSLVDSRTLALADDAEPHLDDCLQIVAHRNAIWEQVDSDRMPPGAWPRLTNEEKLIIRRWIDTGAPAPCI
jgi:uncharacterized membrane protein